MNNFSIRKVYAVFLVMVMMIASLSVQDSTAYAATKTIKSITLKIGSKNVTKKTFKMTKGNSKKLKVSVKPKSLKKSVTYQSKNKKIVTVSKKGNLKAKKAGTAKIIVKVKTKGKKGTTKQTWFKIKVTKKKTTNKKDDIDNNIPEDNSNKPNDTNNTNNTSSTDNTNNNTNESKDDTTSYTVTFNLNYNTNDAYKTISVPFGEKVSQPEDPKRSGYTFDGWYTDTTGGQKFDFNTIITANTTLYAYWNQIVSSGGSNGGSSSSNGNNSNINNGNENTNIKITGIEILSNNTAVTDKVRSGDVLTYKTVPANATGTVTWTVGGTPVEQQSYIVTDMDAGKTIMVSITGTGNYIGTQKSSSCTVDNTIAFNINATDPNKAPVVISGSAIYKTSNGKEITFDDSAKLNLTIQSSDKQTSNEDIIEIKKAAIEDAIGNQDNAEDIKDLTVKALDIDLNLIKTTSEGTIETTEIHPVGETIVTLSATQLGLEGQDISMYYFAAKHKNIDGTEETIISTFEEINGSQYVRFTLNGLSTIWLGNIPPRTVIFDTDGGTAVESQTVKFGSFVNTSLIEEPIRAGYLFYGWNYDLAKTPIIFNLTVRAIWVRGEPMPIEQYTVELTEGTDSAFTLKKANGRITLTLIPEKEIQPNLSYTVTINPLDNAVKYVKGADANTVTYDEKYISLDGNKLQIKGDITDNQGKIKTGTTTAYYKWADAEGNVLALHEIKIVIDDGSGAAEKMEYNTKVNTGIGTYEAYLLDKDGGENARDPFVAYINGNLSGNYRTDYELNTFASFDGYRINNNLKGYDTVELQFSPFEGKSYSSNDTISVNTNDNSNGVNTEQKTEYKIAEDGKLIVTIPLKDLEDNTTWENNIFLYVDVTVNGITQKISVAIRRVGDTRSREYFETDNWNEVVSKLSELSKEKAYDIRYIGSDVILNSSLTIPDNCYLVINNANLTLEKNAILTLSVEDTNASKIDMLQGTLTIAEGGVLTATDQSKKGYGYRTEIMAKEVVIKNGGKVINPENVALGLWGLNNSNISTSFTVEPEAVIENIGDIVIRRFDIITIDGTIDSTYYTDIYGNTIIVGGTIRYANNYSRLQFYGEITITETGSLIVDCFKDIFCCNLTGALNNQGKIQVINGNINFLNTGFSIYNTGTISLDSGNVYARGTKLINTGIINGSGTINCYVSEDTTSYDNGLEYVRVDNDQYWDSESQQIIYKTEDYSRYKFTHEPANNVNAILYKAELINEGSGTCTAKVYTEEFPNEK